MKAIRVYSCANCPYAVPCGPVQFCAMVDPEEPSHRRYVTIHVSLATFPDWCPLEEWPEGKTTE